MSEVETVKLTVDGVEISVPKGTNLIEAARLAGVDVPYYCYHPHLSVAGNCRMCQVQVGGSPKLTIACNTTVQPGMVVATQKTSSDVANAQRATLEFLLINHPLDCTVCDQAGHCKLQDYYYEYNGKPSRFLEEKVNKVKAEILGPEIVYDGERCIMCTRCVRFCDEVTKTSELAGFNRGDRSVIGVQPGRELDNPLAGTVVDLCPVGALTHRRWRFNSRIWYTKEKNSICTGCSTGCSVKVAVRDEQVVLVKARLNSNVNQEWMCDEGRYGFGDFQPVARLSSPLQSVTKEANQRVLDEATWDQAIKSAAGLKNAIAESARAVLLSPRLTLEELWVALVFAEKVMGLKPDSESIAMQYTPRELDSVQAILVSPDRSPNARAANLFGIGAGPNWRHELERRYQNLVRKIREGEIKQVLLVGDDAILDSALDDKMISSLLSMETSVAITTKGVLTGELGETELPLGSQQLCKVLLPCRTVNEKSGIFVNRQLRLQKLEALLTPPPGVLPEWMILARLAKASGVTLLPDNCVDDRAVFREMVKQVPAFSGLTLQLVGDLGIAWDDFEKSKSQSNQNLSENTEQVTHGQTQHGVGQA